MRDIKLGDTDTFQFTTRALTGLPTQLVGGAVFVKEGGNATPFNTGVTLTIDAGGVTGFNEVEIDTSSGYTTLKQYALYLSAGTVATVSQIGEKVGEFTIDRMQRLVNLALDEEIDELPVGVPPVNPTLREVNMLPYMALRNHTEVFTSGTDALHIRNNAGVIICKKLLTDDSADYDENKMISG